MTSVHPTGTVTILFTDLVGSTELMQRLGDDRAEELRRVHFRLLRESVAAHGGREVKTIGDSFMVAFSSTVEALGCAVTMQQAVRAHNEQQEERMRLHVRIGLHVGEPVRDEEDYFGTSVVIARRLCDSARGGQILASGLVRGLVGSRGGFTFFAVGPLTLKGISEPLAVYAVAWEPGAEAHKAFPLSRWAAGGAALALAVGVAAVALVIALSGGDSKPDAAALNGGGSPAGASPGPAGLVGGGGGGELAFVSDRGGSLAIHFINADGTAGRAAISGIPGFDADIDWSPDGKRIAFTSKEAASTKAPSGGGGGGGGGQQPGAGQTENRDVYVVNADGTGLTRLTDHAAEDLEPTWSPDASQIAFTSRRDGNREIYVMSADGTQQKRLTTAPADDFHPDWSPDGSRIAFTSARDGNREIYTMTPEGADVKRLTTHEADDFQAAWSPDSARIAFTSDRDGNREIYVMNAVDGSALVRLTSNRADDFHPGWSPDGSRIAFTSERDGNREIYVMGSDGGGLSRLTEDAGEDSQPIWSPAVE